MISVSPRHISPSPFPVVETPPGASTGRAPSMDGAALKAEARRRDTVAGRSGDEVGGSKKSHNLGNPCAQVGHLAGVASGHRPPIPPTSTGRPAPSCGHMGASLDGAGQSPVGPRSVVPCDPECDSRTPSGHRPPSPMSLPSFPPREAPSPAPVFSETGVSFSMAPAARKVDVQRQLGSDGWILSGLSFPYREITPARLDGVTPVPVPPFSMAPTRVDGCGRITGRHDGQSAAALVARVPPFSPGCISFQSRRFSSLERISSIRIGLSMAFFCPRTMTESE